MIDAGCAWRDNPSERDSDQSERMKLHPRRDEKIRDDRSEGRVFRHVLSVFLIIAIVAVIVKILMLTVSQHFDLVVMILKTSEHLMRVSHCKKQRDDKQEESAITKTGHQRSQR